MIMHKAFQELFETVQADEELKNRTKVFLNQKRQEINSNKTKKSFGFPFYGFLKIGLVSICMGFILWGMYWLFLLPTAQICLEMDSSIELGLNRFNRVVYVRNWKPSETGSLLDNLPYRPYSQVLEQILNQENENPSSKEAIAISSTTSQQANEIYTYVEQHHEQEQCYVASYLEAQAAHEHGLSCQKYQLILELQALDPNIPLENLQEKSMQQLRALKQEIETKIYNSENQIQSELSSEIDNFPNEINCPHHESSSTQEETHPIQQRLHHRNHE